MGFRALRDGRFIDLDEGKIVAEAIAGQAERFDVYARLKHHDFPGGMLLRFPTLVLAMTWFRLRDLLP
jgi:gamma-glutamylputrescine oxidase